MSESDYDPSSSDDDTPQPTLEDLKLLRDSRALLSEAGSSEQYRRINTNATESEILTHKIIQKDMRVTNKAMVLQHYHEKIEKTQKTKGTFDLEGSYWFENYPKGNGGQGKNKYTFKKIETMLYQNTGYKKGDFTEDEFTKALEKKFKLIIDAEGKKTPYMNPTKTFAMIYIELLNLIAQRMTTHCAEEMKNLTEALIPSIKQTLVEQNPLMANTLKTIDFNLQQLVLEQFAELLGKTAYLMSTTNTIARGVLDEKETNESLIQKVREHQILFPASTKEQTWREPYKKRGKNKLVKIKKRKPRLSNYQKFYDPRKNSKGGRERSRRTNRSRSRERRRRSRRKTRQSENRKQSRGSHSRSRSRRVSRSRGRSESKYSQRSRSKSREASTNRKRKRSLSQVSAKTERSQSAFSQKNPNKKPMIEGKKET